MLGLRPPSPPCRSLLDGRGLSCVPPEVGRLTALNKLWLSNNGVRTLAPEIGDLMHLESL